MSETQIRLAERVVGLPGNEAWEMTHDEAPAPGDKEVAIDVEFISLDPNNPTAPPANQADIRKFGHLPTRTWSGMVRYTFPPMDLGTLTVTGSFAREGPKNWLGTTKQSTFAS